MNQSLIASNLQALKNWRVWLHLGLADIRNRFAKSIFGPLWIVLNLGLWVAGIGTIYAGLFKQNIADFLPALTIGFVIWNFLTQTITEGGNAFIFAEGYIKQFTYPKQIYLLRIIVNAGVPLLIGLGLFFVVMLYFMRPFGWAALWAVPGFALLLVTTYMHVTLMAYSSARFRDLPHGMTALLQVLFFITPVFFPVKLLQERSLDFIYQFNPLYYLIEIVRYPLMHSAQAPADIYRMSLLYLALVTAAAWWVAQKLDRRIVYII